MSKNKIIDLFCGCGGLSLGFELAGFETILAIDMWKDAVNTFNHNHNNKPGKCIPVEELTRELLMDYKKQGIVGIVGGPPCQGFSTVGKRDVNDPRNNLYLEYCRVVETVQPEFFVLENVKGLLTLNNGFFVDDITKRFENLGYSVKYKILNASDFGIPQNRQRVFFVGIKNKNFEFPVGNITKISCKEAMSDLIKLDSINGDNEIQKYLTLPQNEYQKKMRANNINNYVYNHQLTHHSEQTINIISLIPDGGKIIDLPIEYWQVRKYNKAFERMKSDSPANTVDTGHRNYFHYEENRIPSVRENARLQSFPDNFLFIGSKTSQYKQVGNAVPPLLSKALAIEIKKHIGGK